MYIDTLNITELIANEEITVSSLGTLVRNARLKKELSINQLAELVGVHRQMIYLLESDIRSPEYEYLQIIEEILNIDVGEYDKRYRFTKHSRENLQKTREKLNMSRNQFAEYVGIDAYTIDGWIYKDKRISRKYFNALCAKLGDDFIIV